MPDLGGQLQRYIDGAAAPITIGEVQEMDASPGLEHRSDASGRTRTRWLAGAAAVAAVALFAWLSVGMRGDDTEGRLDVGATTSSKVVTTEVGEVVIDPTQAEFELLDMRAGPAAMGSLYAAVDEAELRALWTAIGFDGEPDEVDFGRWVVVSITIPDDACPPALAGFDRDRSTWTPHFVEPGGGCIQPLVPKTYVVALNRAEVAPSFTLRLPADPYDDYPEQLLTVAVPPVDPSASTPTTTDPAVAVEVVGRVPLPPLGEARSSVLETGLPVWVVHHEDGSVTAVPAVVAGSDREVGIDGLWSLVQWSPAGSFHGGAGAWDAWGRAITGGRDVDLSDFSARIDGDAVVIETSGHDRVPGEPIVPEGFGIGNLDPELPALVDVGAGLPEGWSQVDATLVTSGGIARVCAVEPGVPVGELGACPPDAPQVQGLVGSPGSTSWNFGPLLVDVDESGTILHVVASGGSAGRADG